MVALPAPAHHRLHGSPAPVRAEDQRLVAVVVAPRSREWQVGAVVNVTMLPER